MGGRRLYTSLLTSSGSHSLSVSSPDVPLSGHLQVRCHTKHAKLLHDTVSITYVSAASIVDGLVNSLKHNEVHYCNVKTSFMSSQEIIRKYVNSVIR